MTTYVDAWQCIGCGRVEAARPCIGVCQDRKIRFVDANEYETVAHTLATERAHAAALMTLVRQLAWSTPRGGDWESSYRALQSKARVLLASCCVPGGVAPTVVTRRLPA